MKSPDVIEWRKNCVRPKKNTKRKFGELSKELAQAKQVLIDEIVIHERVVDDLKQSNAELRKSQERTDLMLRSVQMAGGSLELNQVLERIAEMLAVATGMPHCGIYLMDEEKKILIRHAGTNSLNSSQLALAEHLQIRSRSVSAYSGSTGEPETDHLPGRQVRPTRQP